MHVILQHLNKYSAHNVAVSPQTFQLLNPDVPTYEQTGLGNKHFEIFYTEL